MKKHSLAVMCAASLATVGCANVHVKKVSVDKRINGRDHHVQGFRYYTSRPYVVVSQAVPVSTDKWPARLVEISAKPGTNENPPNKYALELLHPMPGATERGLYDLSGHPLSSSLFEVTARLVVPPAETVGGDGGTPKETPPVAPKPKEEGELKPDPLEDSEPRDVVPPTPSSDQSPFSLPPSLTPATSNLMSRRDPAVAAAQLASNQGRPVGVPDLASGVRRPVPSALDEVVTDASEPPPFQVVFLPDFEEQFAIRNVNRLAKSKYNLHFTDGWSLDNFQGNYNATDVPVRLLQTLGNIIDQASAFEVDRIKAEREAEAPEEGGVKDSVPARDEVRFFIQRVRKIEPGMYRIQKSWEKVAAGPVPDVLPPDATAALLADLGIPLVETTEIVKIVQDR